MQLSSQKNCSISVGHIKNYEYRLQINDAIDKIPIYSYVCIIKLYFNLSHERLFFSLEF